MMRKKSCGAVVFRKNREVKYLLLHYEAGHWDYVKGEVEKGESERDTVVRELMEETGITDARFIEGFREEIRYFFKMGGRTVYKEAVFFLMETETSEVVLSFEHTGYEWLDYQKAIERLTFENAKNILRKAHTFLKEQRIIENGHR
ncbi:bis(5'-nucleosyl)-tetraphosphatase [Candidatus Methanoperedens nitratireducens]|uniref:Bis(5'-nucleosyl)-tetraphosphatase [asymmetrical] n=1 Tax=Candidatus Methanoperedens nitratireducens TaxID=1392998 RepID=A0A284VR97_9EURY|nr:NUDIX domain-containing protein [Candidatus Methanoperedens nitroreducens]SNQ61814.1 Bis(5'-nucleosyl)-tetraphosphatase(asymmetrical) [Candidatus Methanoperedens nitroreducens]